MQEGTLDDEDKAMHTEEMGLMRQYILPNALVLGTTPINACSSAYFFNFKPTIIVGDEMNRATIAETVAVMTHYEAGRVHGEKSY